jgi:site-specific DNA-cytosine methylase
MKHQKTMRFRNKITGEIREISRHLFNSALVSAQNRQRYYWTNIPNVPQPTDRGLLIKDILETTTNEKGYCLSEPICFNINPNGKGINGEVIGVNQKSRCVLTNKGEGQKIIEPIDYQPYGELKSGQNGLYCTSKDGTTAMGYTVNYIDGKAPTVISGQASKMKIIEPIRIGDIGSNSQAHRVYSAEGKSVTINAGGGGQGGKTGLYACPIKYLNDKNMEHLMRPYGSKGKILHRDIEKTPTLMSAMGAGGGNGIYIAENWDGKTYPVYEVINGLITIKDKQYPIKLPDGFYIIRKLTVLECKRLQTVRDNYIMPCSNSQNYKMLGNGWTVDVIVHILSHIPDIENCEVEVLSMYDGMSCGNLALEKLGCKVSKYISYEIDKYAIQTTQANFPYVIQKGDAFQVRNDNWEYTNA